MSHPDQFARAEILARCLEAIQSGEMTVEQCAAHYPDVSGLAESLRIALSLRHVESDQVAFPDVRKQALERRLLQVMDQRWSQKSTVTTALRVLRPLATAAALIVVISAMLLGLARVSRSALPGDTLYGYKRFVESAELSFASAAAKPDLLRSMAELRLDELNMVIVRDHRVDVALLRDVAHSVNEAIAAQPESAQNRLLYDRAQQVFAFAASEGVTDATAVASTISTPVPQPTALISVGTATSTAVQVSVTPTGSPTSAASTFTATATVTSTMTPSATITVAPSLTVTSTSTLHRVILITATSLPTFTPTYTHTAAADTATPTPSYTPSATSLLPTPILPTLSPDQLTPTITLTPSATFAFTLTPIVGIPPATEAPAPTQESSTPESSAVPPTETPTETPVILPPCPTETATPTSTLDTDPTLTPTFTLTPAPDDFTPTPTETPLPCMPISTDTATN